MNYPESLQILEEIKKSNRILINCHRSPDPDSIGSALSLKMVLEDMGKKAEVVCVSEDLYENVNYLKGYSEIVKNTDFAQLDYSRYDLFISPDSSSPDQITGNKDLKLDKIKLVLIDHHLSNPKFGDINLVDPEITSVGELLFNIYSDWGLNIKKDVAECLMAAMVGDTGAFRYPGVGISTYKTVISLMEIGADKDFAIQKLYGSEPFELIKFYGETLNRVRLDKEHKFVYSAIPYDAYIAVGKPATAKESAASLFCQIVEGTDFGFIALEKEPQKLSVSFRSRTGFDTSKIAVELGGGGHIYASGAAVNGMGFEDALNKVLNACRQHAQKAN
jgi:phosphoesterase RecJ-like protein